MTLAARILDAAQQFFHSKHSRRNLVCELMMQSVTNMRANKFDRAVTDLQSALIFTNEVAIKNLLAELRSTL
jgi:hypothetical protein